MLGSARPPEDYLRLRGTTIWPEQPTFTGSNFQGASKLCKVHLGSRGESEPHCWNPFFPCGLRPCRPGCLTAYTHILWNSHVPCQYRLGGVFGVLLITLILGTKIFLWKTCGKFLGLWKGCGFQCGKLKAGLAAVQHRTIGQSPV